MHNRSHAHSATRLPAAIWVLGSVSLLMDTSSELIHSLLPVFLVTVLGASGVAVGLIEGVAEAAALIVKIFSGTLSDRLGRRKGLVVFGYGLAAVTKPLFAVATGVGAVFTARFLDRIAKGIRGAPRDALIADLVTAEVRGAAYGLRQALDTVGALAGPLLAMVLMFMWSNDFRAVFWVAVIPGVLAVVLLLFGVHEPVRPAISTAQQPVQWRALRRLHADFWWVVALGAMFSLARFSEAFLVLRAQSNDLSPAWLPLVLVVMNGVYALSAYPFGRWSDRANPVAILAPGLVVLIIADTILAQSADFSVTLMGVAVWGLHMGMTQGLLARMVADTAPKQSRGTAFGIYYLISGVTMLMGNALAGLLWDVEGPAATFYTGAVFCALALGVIGFRRARMGAP